MDQLDGNGIQEMQLLASSPPGDDKSGLFEQGKVFHDAETSHGQLLDKRAQRQPVFLE